MRVTIIITVIIKQQTFPTQTLFAVATCIIVVVVRATHYSDLASCSGNTDECDAHCSDCYTWNKRDVLDGTNGYWCGNNREGNCVVVVSGNNREAERKKKQRKNVRHQHQPKVLSSQSGRNRLTDPYLGKLTLLSLIQRAPLCCLSMISRTLRYQLSVLSLRVIVAQKI